MGSYYLMKEDIDAVPLLSGVSFAATLDGVIKPPCSELYRVRTAGSGNSIASGPLNSSGVEGINKNMGSAETPPTFIRRVILFAV